MLATSRQNSSRTTRDDLCCQPFTSAPQPMFESTPLLEEQHWKNKATPAVHGTMSTAATASPRNFAISEQSVALYNQLRKTASQHAGWLQVYLPALIQRSQRWRLTAGGLDKAVSNSGWNVEPLPKLAPHTQSILASAMRSVVKAVKTASMPPHHSSEKLVRVTATHWLQLFYVPSCHVWLIFTFCWPAASLGCQA